MKVRIYPKVATVRAIMEERINRLHELIEVEHASVEAITTPSKGQYVSEALVKAHRDNAEAYTQTMEVIAEQITLLASHDPPECLVEIEL